MLEYNRLTREDFDVKKIIGINLTINDEVLEIKDYNKPKLKLKYNTYKVLWLPHGADLQDVSDFILEQLENTNQQFRVVKCYEEIYKDLDDIEHDKEETQIKTGNVIVKVSYLENVFVKNISGVNKNFQEKKVRIIQYGDAKKCFSCQATDHIKINFHT